MSKNSKDFLLHSEERPKSHERKNKPRTWVNLLNLCNFINYSQNHSVSIQKPSSIKTPNSVFKIKETLNSKRDVEHSFHSANRGTNLTLEASKTVDNTVFFYDNIL